MMKEERLGKTPGENFGNVFVSRQPLWLEHAFLNVCMDKMETKVDMLGAIMISGLFGESNGSGVVCKEVNRKGEWDAQTFEERCEPKAILNCGHECHVLSLS
jgi:hypothetical protein